MEILTSGRGVLFSAEHNGQIYKDPTALLDHMAKEFVVKYGAEYSSAVEAVMAANPVLAREYIDITGS